MLPILEIASRSISVSRTSFYYNSPGLTLSGSNQDVDEDFRIPSFLNYFKQFSSQVHYLEEIMDNEPS